METAFFLLPQPAKRLGRTTTTPTVSGIIGVSLKRGPVGCDKFRAGYPVYDTFDEQGHVTSGSETGPDRARLTP